MRRGIAVAAIMGFNVGACWLFAARQGVRFSTPSGRAWATVMWVSCPAIAAFRLYWLLVPILNALLYAAIAVVVNASIQFILPFIK
jgi:hypothetical protein